MKPKFSIIIPIAPDRMAEVLVSLNKLDYQKNQYEVIIEKGTNPSDNRNKGAKKAKGEIIAFLDDDALIKEDLLKEAENFFNQYPDIHIVGGPQLTPFKQKTFGKISGYALSSRFGAGNITKRYKKSKLNLNADETTLTSANLFCKKEIFSKIQFDPKLYPGEDPDFIARAKKSNFKVAYSPNIIIYHKRRESIGKLAKQVFKYGITRPAKESLFETLKRPAFLVPSLFITYLFISALLTLFLFPSNFLYLIYLPLIIYIISSFLFSLFLSIKNRNILSLFALPIIFLTIHLYYGIGMLFGIFGKK